MSTFFIWKFFTQLFSTYSLALLFVKQKKINTIVPCKLLVKLTIRGKFLQQFTSSFFEWKCYAQLFSHYNLALLFVWQKNINAKVPCKLLVKLTIGVNWTNNLWAAFSYKSFFGSFYVLQFEILLFGQKETGRKTEQCWWKLSQGV